MRDRQEATRRKEQTMTNDKFNITNHGTIRGQVIGDNAKVLQEWFDTPIVCPHCKAKTWKRILNGKQVCPDCSKEIATEE